MIFKLGLQLTILIFGGISLFSTAGLLVHKMGLPVELVCAVNENDIVHRAVSTGVFTMSEVVQQTWSTAMDIQVMLLLFCLWVWEPEPSRELTVYGKDGHKLKLEKIGPPFSSFSIAILGGILWISSDRGDRKGAKIKTQKNPKGFKQNPKKPLDQNLTKKNPMLNFRAIKISRKH